MLVIEDDAYGELAYEGPVEPSLYALAGGRGVIKIGTFSKTIATGLRVGLLQASPPLIDAMLAPRFDMGLSPYLLRLIAAYVRNGRYEAHLEAVRDLYRRKRDVMLASLSESCADLARWHEPRGGFFVWLELDPRVDPTRLWTAAEAEGVAYVGGRGFFTDLVATDGMRASGHPGNAASRFVRLSFSYAAEDQIAEGVQRFGRALRRSLIDQE